MKQLLSLTGLLVSSHLYAYTIDTDACVGTEHIYDLSGELVEYDPTLHSFVDENTPVFYAGYESLPHIYVGADQYSTVFIENTSNVNINFFFRPTYYSNSGQVSNVSLANFGRVFSSVNTPLAAGGASMPPQTLGTINFSRRGTSYYGSASIYWDSSDCLKEKPLRGSSRTVFSNNNNGRGGVSIYLINGGDTW